MKYFLLLSLLTMAGIAFSQQVKLNHLPSENKVEVTVDGKPFTSYYFPGPELIKKPVLYPVYSPQGKLITRGWPLDPRPGERVDHPHHIGVWFNYEDINGNDFWNNSVQANRPGRKMGTILNTKVIETSNGRKNGQLATTSHWVDYQGTHLLTDTTRITFTVQSKNVYTVDYEIVLHAIEEVQFRDVKDGMFAIRLSRELELKYNDPQLLTGPDGKVNETKIVDNQRVSGSYRNKEGLKDDAVWGKPSEWCAMSGTIQKENITVAIIDHPDNFGYPAYFHARGYGLFSLNSVARSAFDKSKPPHQFNIEKGQSKIFRYRLIFASQHLSDQEIQKLAKR